MDVEYFHSSARDPVEDFVRIPNERSDSHARALYHLFRAHWPLADAALYTSKSLSKRCRYARIIGSDERQNLIQIAQRLVRIDYLHLTAMLGNDRFHFLIRGKPPFPRGLRPRSMPSSSSSVAPYVPPLMLASSSSAISASSSFASAGQVSARR